jgi:hypothetical protein
MDAVGVPSHCTPDKDSMAPASADRSRIGVSALPSRTARHSARHEEKQSARGSTVAGQFTTCASRYSTSSVVGTLALLMASLSSAQPGAESPGSECHTTEASRRRKEKGKGHHRRVRPVVSSTGVRGSFRVTRLTLPRIVEPTATQR